MVRPDETLGYWLMQTMRSVANAFADALQTSCDTLGKPYVITPPQYFALGLLVSEHNLPIGTLAQRLAVDASVATGIVKRLEQHGLVERVHDREDYRRVRLRLTAEGADIAQALDAVAAAFNQQLLQGFSPVESGLLLDSLAQIRARARAAHGEASPRDVASDLVSASGPSASEQGPGE